MRLAQTNEEQHWRTPVQGTGIGRRLLLATPFSSTDSKTLPPIKGVDTEMSGTGFVGREELMKAGKQETIPNLVDTKTKEAARDTRCPDCGRLLELLEAAALREASHTELLDEARWFAQCFQGRGRTVHIGTVARRYQVDFTPAQAERFEFLLAWVIERARTPEEDAEAQSVQEKEQ